MRLVTDLQSLVASLGIPMGSSAIARHLSTVGGTRLTFDMAAHFRDQASVDSGAASEFQRWK
eukprot:5356637-Alexandrium_andersonii.AAC.1